VWAGASVSWLALSWIRMIMLGWERMECFLHGESSHTGSIKMAKNGLVVMVEHVRA
jgi:hypothetical protein